MPQTVLITGSSSGFGRRAVERFRREGWDVVATLRDPERWTGEPEGDHLRLLPLDVRDDASVTRAIGDATAGRRLDCVVNNAGAGLFSVFEGTPHPVIEDLFETNVYGPMRVIRAVLPHFHAHGGGRIVNVTSSSATVPTALMAAYAASKSALQGFSEGVSYELRTRNVELKVVEPGLVPSTGFYGQTERRFATVQTPEGYAGYVTQRLASFAGEPPAGYLATDEDVAAGIFEAATDATGRFRFRIGGDAADFARARQAPDAEYDAWRLALYAAR